MRGLRARQQGLRASQGELVDKGNFTALYPLSGPQPKEVSNSSFIKMKGCKFQRPGYGCFSFITEKDYCK